MTLFGTCSDHVMQGVPRQKFTIAKDHHIMHVILAWVHVKATALTKQILR